MTRILSQVSGKVYLMISLALFGACSTEEQPQQAQSPFAAIASTYKSDLEACLRAVERLEAHTDKPAQLQAARRYFKQAELVMAFAENADFIRLNRPNILVVKEEDQTDIKVMDPLSFQVLEELIYAEEPVDSAALLRNTTFVRARLEFLLRNANLGHYHDYHFLWMLRMGIYRIATNGITGFDSPVLANSLAESALVYSRMKEYLSYYQERFADPALYQNWVKELDASISLLEAADFDHFNRYDFIKAHSNAQLALLVQTARDWQVEFPREMVLHNNITNLFDIDNFNLNRFSDRLADPYSQAKVVLGKQLFSDPSLSRSKEMSCASCHQEALAFTDALPRSPGQTRNSPTLTYAGYQRAFFYDNRSGSLEGQIVSVVNSETEFHTDLAQMTAAVAANAQYQHRFDSLYKDGLTEHNIRNAIANYVRSLGDFSSRFDQNMRNEKSDLTETEIKGFNLFMGKAACATCHFPPLFNGTVPPEYQHTEMELIGVARTAANREIDPDVGAYSLFGTEARRFFFKTPTVRNAALTAPYMHNGAYISLEQVMDFYNNGGGAGMGFDLPLQTLPFDSLNLNTEEQEAIIAFMNSLTDARFAAQP